MNKLLSIFSVILLLSLSSCFWDEHTSGVDSGSECQEIGGKFDEKHSECLGIGKEECEAIDGTFNECGSACRHGAPQGICTMQCIQFCILN